MALDLWDDPKFIQKRIDEQWAYLKKIGADLHRDDITAERYDELASSAMFQAVKFQNRLAELNSLAAYRLSRGEGGFSSGLLNEEKHKLTL